jgi:hypothetical protein
VLATGADLDIATIWRGEQADISSTTSKNRDAILAFMVSPYFRE